MSQSEKLADLLADFARTLGGDFRVQDILDHLVERIVDVLPVTGAGVMLMGAGNDLPFVAASNEAIQAIETLQNELGEGPCLEAYRSGQAVAVPDLSEDDRFADFSERARDAGLAAVFTFPMSLNGSRFGALDLYRDTSGELNHADMSSAQVLADVAAVYIHNARGRADAVDTLDLLRQRSLYDPLTGLPNRTLLKERIEHAVARARRFDEVVAVLYVDLDHFKAVNDQYGHHVGDQVLVAVANRLGRVLRSSDTLCRLSGDEFVIVCEGVEEPDFAERVAQRVTDALSPVFEFNALTLEVSASVGIAFTGPGTEFPDSLLRDADFATYEAKRDSAGQDRAFDPATRSAADRRGQLVRDLSDALERSQFQLAYQPVVDVRRGDLVGVEALLRWQHPTRGWVKPEEILGVAERTGLILEIGAWVIGQACTDLKRWQERYGRAIPKVAINVSPYQVMAPDFHASVERALRRTGVDPASVCLEVTENAFLEDGPRALTVLKSVKDLGVSLVLDDFGTGYSSLNYLRRFPFDVIKIDRSFIGGLAADDGTYEIVAAIIDLAHGLKLDVVAEGIETQQQLSQVTSLGADQAQGFHICRPIIGDQVEPRLLNASTRPIRLAVPTPTASFPQPRMSAH
jgi:diguanylate cyclase (GGDEF)-like protein